MPALSATLEKLLILRQEQGILRSLKKYSNLIDLASNDFLGFARSPQLRKIVEKERQDLEAGPFLGSTGSRLLTGNTSYCEELEAFIADFHRAECGLIFNCGYMANLGLLSSVVKSTDTVLYDLCVHASTHDGMRLSKAKCLPWRHNDVESLEIRLKKSSGNVFVCVESIYSIDGTVAPLEEIVSLCKSYGANLIVDEAHATGIIGELGEGLVSALKLEKEVFARIHTFSKALGSQGAIVLGSTILKEYLLNYARPFIYTTAMPLEQLIAIKCAYRHLVSAGKERSFLQNLIRKFFEYGIEFKIPLLPSATPIFPLYVCNPEKAQGLSKFLLEKGFDARAILSPTAKRGEECLRICLHAFNTEDEIKELFSLISMSGVRLCVKSS